MTLNLPWTIEFDETDWTQFGGFRWLILDKWGVVIGRFSREDQAQACVDGANLIHYAIG